MKKILLVDDDALVRTIYQRKLEQGGFEVRTAEDGLQAVQLLGSHTPDLILLDLMMPRLSGPDVLRFVRSKPGMAQLPVVVLTNAFMSDQARAVSAMGVTRAITKGECTPEKMLDLVRQIFGMGTATESKPSAAPPAPALSSVETHNPAREQFLAQAGSLLGDMRQVCQEFNSERDSAARSGSLADLYRQVHHLTGAAGTAGCFHLALMSGALEALLFELVEKPQYINPSTTRTIVAAVDFLTQLCEDARAARRNETLTGTVLVVDDDPLAIRIATTALNRARLTVRSTDNPMAALDLIGQDRFDLFLLDVEMPQLNGYDLCRKIRCQPDYEKTPVIYVTAHSDFENRSKGILSGGSDLIAKPIFPIELAVKAVTHIIRGRLAASAPATL
jgi:CheY-like chemotaxis protein